ncbi:MAG: hypothetical protein GWP91_24820 [Rhodobacterales bacterium]|nr:hypothetical protein [Rhodobacterales bacterium]
MCKYWVILALLAVACSNDKNSDTGGGSNALPSVFVNEVMPSNATVLQDEIGAFPDWVELYNAGGKAVDLSGYFLTDNLTNTDKWEFPGGATIPANGYLIIFCDSDPEEGSLHTSFNLEQLGEEVGLYGPLDGGNVLIDSMDYGVIAADTSLARIPDGSENWELAYPATPEASN